MDQPKLSTIKFLIVDDMTTIKRIIRTLLRDLGYFDVEEAENGVKALQAMRFSRPDIVISDINMPMMNGLELISAMKEKEELKDIPVLLVTAEAKKEDILEASKRGAAGYVVKPFTPATLEAKINGILSRYDIAGVKAS